MPNGHNPVIGQWVPFGEGTNFEMTPSLAALEPFRDQMVIPSGLRHHQADSWGDGDGDHARGCGAWLSGVHIKRTAGPDIRGGVTIDQMAARVKGQYTRLPSLETSLESVGSSGACTDGYACGYQIWFSWATPPTPLYHEPDPRRVFERMFGDGSSPEEQKARLRTERSILDSVTEEVARLNQRLGAGDRRTVDGYLEAVRDVERRIQQAEQYALTVAPPDLPDELPDTFEEHAKMILDLQVLAFQGDITRVFTTLIGREQGRRSYVNSGVTEGHHSMSHHRNDPEKQAALTKITQYLLRQPAYFFDRLRSIPEGDGNLLDHSLILIGGGLGDPNIHNHMRLPAVLVGGAGGRLRGGRHLAYPDTTPMSNLLVSMLNMVDVPTQVVGDSTGELVGL